MLKMRTAEKTGAGMQAAGFAASLIGGFLLAETKFAGAASFTNISLTGAAGLPYAAAVLTGSIIRYMTSESIAKNMIQLSAMVICVIFKLFFESKTSPKYCGIITAAAVFVSGTAVSAILHEIIYKLVFYAFYGAVAGFTAYSLALIMESLRNQLVLDLSAPVSCAYAVVYTIFTASLCSIDIPFVNTGIIVGTAVTVTAAYHYRYTGGILCGALTACGAYLCSSVTGLETMLLPAAGFLTGYLHKQKAGIAAGCFVAMSFVITVFTGVGTESISRMLNIIIGTAVFIFVSPYFSDKLVMTGIGEGDALTGIIGSRMNFLATSIRTIRTESGKIFEVLAKNAEKPDEIGINSSEVCGTCHKRLACWYNSREITERGFQRLSGLSEITRNNFPYELEDCLHRDELIKAFEKTSREKMTAKLLELRFSESQRLLFEQIKITEEIIAAAGERTDVRCSAPISRTIAEKLKKYSYNAKNVIAYYNSRNRLQVELYFAYADAPKNCLRVCDLIADELKINLDYSEPVNSGKEVRIRLFERPDYSLEIYGASVCAEDSSETGDSTAVFSDGTGMSYVILSDGMGTGRGAALESRMVVSMFRRLISSGVQYNSAIKLINSIMLAKSADEAFATLDAVRIDRDTCELTVIKSGASATLIRHRGQVMKIATPTFPIGIVEEADTFARNYDFEENDIIIMFSDGISEGEYQFIKELLLQNDDVKMIVDEICAKAELFNPNLRSDDVTVIGIKVYKSEDLT
ncbi:MAG: hypothetical protein E7497_00160 [Ruminococcus sp.]|nr:hypothetical protein [Ruminococcus sp.]